VLRRIPAIRGYVDAPTECQTLVYHDYLLVVGGADRMGAVELKPEAPARDGIQDEQWSHTAAERLDHAEVPLKQIDVQPGALLRQP
jgi:hypothetical protein